ncbi:hypothetical protein [Kitasatospora sp. NPDC048407]
MLLALPPGPRGAADIKHVYGLSVTEAEKNALNAPLAVTLPN